LRRLRAAGFGGPEFDLWLVALRPSDATPVQAARRLGLEPRIMRPRVSRWMANPACAALVERDDSGNYRLTPVGAARADKVVRQLRVMLAGLQHPE
jgi:hypothetical protein